MPKHDKDRGKKTTKTPQEPGNTQKTQQESSTNEEGEDSENVITLPGKEHCEWLLRIIKINAKKVAEELLVSERQKTDSVIRGLKEEINNLRREVKQCNDSKNQLETELAKLQYAKNGINKDLSKQRECISDLKVSVDKINQKQRESRIKIAGIKEQDDENLEKTVTKYAKSSLGVKLKSGDIVEVFRVGKKKSQRTRDITVQFSTKKVRDNLYACKKKETNTAPEKHIYVNEDLTLHRQKLLFDARHLMKRKKIKGSWTQGGNVMILPNEGGPLPVYTHDDLRRILEETYAAISIPSTEILEDSGGDEYEDSVTMSDIS